MGGAMARDVESQSQGAEPVDWSRQTTLQSARWIEVSLEAHKKIFQTIADRAPDRAAAAMREHLDQIQQLIVARAR
jgi:DNA-binding FadR family transcriptional regulator